MNRERSAPVGSLPSYLALFVDIYHGVAAGPWRDRWEGDV
jgi:hypothetical protein